MHNHILEHIASHLQSHTGYKEQHGTGLLGGISGQLLFYWQLSKQHPAMVNEALFHEQLELIQQNLPQLAAQPAFAQGLSGVAWFLDLINFEQSGADYDRNYSDDLDQCLLHHLSQGNWDGNTEFMSGLAGIAVYGARRFQQANKADIALSVLRQIEQQALEISSGKVTWSKQQTISPSTGLNSKAKFDLGLAHGVVSVLAALIALAQIPDCRLRASKLLKTGCSWLLAQALPRQGFSSCFGNFAGQHEDSRLGWCYGDLGIALTLARAGDLLEDENLTKQATAIALSATERTNPGRPVLDAALCHGSCGISLLFLRLYQLLKAPKLKQAADYWYKDSLRRYRENKLSGLMAYDADNKCYQESMGLLNGYAGIGLYLLYYQQSDNSWLDALLLA